ncbi:hypothetical protein GA0115256_12471, partial [Streptomyces sp. DconLS]
AGSRLRPESERDAPGTAAWRLGPTGPPDAVSGYPDRVSVTPGESFGLRVSTTAAAFRVSAFRIGWYGGAGARRIWASGRTPGRARAAPRVLAATRTVFTDWPVTLPVDTTGWPEGAYLLRLEADTGHQRYIPFVVRSTDGTGRTVLLHAPATWQAYNRWGGASLYTGADGGYSGRSLAVSFDRPYDGSGAEKFLTYERALVVLAERLGIPLAYSTGTDVHRDPGVLRGAHAVVCLGHDEYWTPEQRAHVTAARDAGVNIAFLGANTCFRRVRLEPGAGALDRTVVCYKSDYRADPCYPSTPAQVTTDYRLPPGADPESALTGVLYEGYPVDAPYVVRAPGHWAYDGTGVRAGDGFAHLVGVEYDRVTPGAPTPGPLEITAHSPLVCGAARATATRRTTPPPPERGCSRPAPCAGWRACWPEPANSGATTGWTPAPARSSPAPRRTCCGCSRAARPPGTRRRRTPTCLRCTAVDLPRSGLVGPQLVLAGLVEQAPQMLGHGARRGVGAALAAGAGVLLVLDTGVF